MYALQSCHSVHPFTNVRKVEFMIKRLLLIAFMMIALTISACGTIATPEAHEAEHTDEAVVGESEAVDEEPTEVAELPTDTPTPEPPTAIPTEAPTSTPESTTEAPTEEVAQSAGSSRITRIIQSSGDPANGEVIFNTFYDETGFACATCHTIVEGAPDGIGPNQYNLYQRAGERVEGQSAEDYVYTSIIDPNAHIVEGFEQRALMPLIYETILTQQEIFDLVVYVLSIGDE